MRIESVDLFYLSMPEIRDIADGSQDALLVRLRAGEYVGWGECDASPLTSIASFVCPMSHAVCKPVRDSVLGQALNDVEDIRRIGNLVRENSLDLLQTDHTLSGIDIAMWDLLGKRLQAPVYELLGYDRAYPKIPYASQLFGDTPQETWEKARRVRREGYRATKFGWGPFGRETPAQDAEHLHAAREGLGPEGILLVDAGTVWGEDVEAAALRIEALEACDVTWLEEPFTSEALGAYKRLSALCDEVGLAGGEGCHNYYMAQRMIDRAGLGYIQIDAGRIGGISQGKRVADYAQARGLTYVNHTFTTHLALSASLQPFAGLENDVICEYPVEPSAMARELTQEKVLADDEGCVHLPETPGLGMTPAPRTLQQYLVDVEIRVDGKVLYRTPEI
ncbi:MAG: mandelate racemase/muconate lactonizing enzyme family protein [Chloroflexota bacterium]|nr:mandelate racemase/muconate lactonizing enzyme family protein [Chloroflexota bacterium]